MDQQNSSVVIDEASVLTRKSWTAHLIPTVLAMLFLGVIVPFAWAHNPLIGALLGVAATGLYLYIVFTLRSYKLYFDDTGVWVSSGIFPWNRGTSGVKWRDLDEAVYFTGFFSWLFHSYTIRIGHRFTKASEITLTDMDEGNKVVEKINAAHHSLLAEE